MGRGPVIARVAMFAAFVMRGALAMFRITATSFMGGVGIGVQIAAVDVPPVEVAGQIVVSR